MFNKNVEYDFPEEKYLSVSDVAEKYGTTARTVRGWCADGKMPGAFLIGKTWAIPFDAPRPVHDKKLSLLEILRAEKDAGISGGIYHKTQIELTYNSNHIEGSRLTEEETRYIFETNTIGMENGSVKVDDIVETVNHFRCVDMIIDDVNKKLTEPFIKRLHFTLKSGTSDSRKKWFAVGEYKRLANEIGGHDTTPPAEVSSAMRSLLSRYNSLDVCSLDDILDFHFQFERIHPFQDGNGRVGRLILFKECLRNDVVPFIIEDEHKYYYYRGLQNWKSERGWLRDTCLSAQDKFKTWLDYFGIAYKS